MTENCASYKAAIRTGLALGIMCKSAVEPAARVLGVAEGLPAVLTTSRTILKNKQECRAENTGRNGEGDLRRGASVNVDDDG